MTRLILTSLAGVTLMREDFADAVVCFTFRFVWGPLPSPDELAAYLAARSDHRAPRARWARAWSGSCRGRSRRRATYDSRENLGARHKAVLRSRLSLTEFGEAIVAHKEDFSRHNPIDRWWGGTRLTNDRMWRWNPVLIAPQPV
jgi:hypothetical protein